MIRSFALWTALLSLSVAAQARDEILVPENPAIDMVAHLETAQAAAAHRATRRLTETQFMNMARQPGVVVLDARSAAKYAQLHIAGAVNLSFPDFTQQSLAQAIGGLETTVLIYCNNNFRNEPEAFPTKRIDVALNLSTYESLYAYGYRNIYELAPLLDPATANLPFAGSLASPEMAAR